MSDLPEVTDDIQEAVFHDLGFGSVLADESQERLLNRDGSFNIRRRGLVRGPYHVLLVMSWPQFIGLLAAVYVVTNVLFGAGYLLAGPASIHGLTGTGAGSRFMEGFFFSVQTLSTVGYGQLYPVGLAANILMTAEGIVGLLAFALSAGLVFARFSRPTADIVFSRNAVVAPYRGEKAFEFRIVNQRQNEIIELRAKVVFSQREVRNGRAVRRFYDLHLERDRVTFFPASWTIVHPIDKRSPLHGLSPEGCRWAEAEFLVLLTGMDDTFSQVVHARTSYKADEVIWNARFEDILQRPSDRGPLSIDVHEVHGVERMESTGEAA
jgi:inward rectifier potassium channel